MCNLFLHVSTRRAIIISRPFFLVHQVILEFGTLTSFEPSVKVEGKIVNKALRILDKIVPKDSRVDGGDARHHRLIQGCMQDLLEIGHQKCFTLVKEAKCTKSTDQLQVSADKILNNNVTWRTGISLEENPLSLFTELLKRGINPDESVISWIMSLCGATGSLGVGVQLHAFTIKTGFDKLIPTGSSLVSLYSKCGMLEDAYCVFDGMAVKNTVSWTAIIAGYAQHWQLETCIYLFISMIQSEWKPNDFTFSSLLSACTTSASLGLGKSIHSLEIRMGFNDYIHVSNALISMYAKCGSIQEAQHVFDKMPLKDHISWNSMIFGFAQYGLAEQAVKFLKEMDKQNAVPDALSYLGVLSSCRHAGLVEQGRRCFNSMLKSGITPELDHYSCIVDLLGRAGLLEEALGFIENMPIPPNAVIWGSLLSSCRVHGNVWIGIRAAESRLLLEPGCAATHVQLANLYAGVGCWSRVAQVRKLMKDRGLKTSPGYSWLEIGNKVYRFKAEDRSNTKVNEIIILLDGLADHLKWLDHTSDVNVESQDWEAL